MPILQYKDPDVVSKIKAVTNDSLHHALDTISTETTEILSVNALGPGSGKVIVILAPHEAASKLRSDVAVQSTSLSPSRVSDCSYSPGSYQTRSYTPRSALDLDIEIALFCDIIPNKYFKRLGDQGMLTSLFYVSGSSPHP